MIGRLWHGWTTTGNADAYGALLQSTVIPGIDRVEGFRGAYVLRRDAGAEVEFVTLTLFESLDAVRAFAGDDDELAKVSPEARTLLSRFDERAAHFEVVSSP